MPGAKRINVAAHVTHEEMRRHIGLSAIMHGVNVGEHMEVLDADGNAIEGLYAIGKSACADVRVAST